jgi:hypothetical protein
MREVKMRSATECAPKKCICGRKLSKPSYKTVSEISRSTNGSWQIVCKCHLIYLWSYHPKSNGCWKIRSALPLFDTEQIVVVA